MTVIIAIDDVWDEPYRLARVADDSPPLKVPMCRCRGSVVIDMDRCLWCGRYLRDLYRHFVVDDGAYFRELEHLMRERPHETVSRLRAAA